MQQTNEKVLLPRQVSVALGAHNLKNNGEIGRYNVGVKNITLHDNWNPATNEYDGDIAIIKMADKIRFNNFMRPVCLPVEEVNDVNNGEVASWGVYDDVGTVSFIPRKIEMPIVNKLKCLKEEKGLIDTIWDEAFCAGKRGAGVCQGDSGAGFYVSKNGKFYLRGIVSSSVRKPCSESNLALYSDVIKYINFIKTSMELSQTGTTVQINPPKPTPKPTHWTTIQSQKQ